MCRTEQSPVRCVWSSHLHLLGADVELAEDVAEEILDLVPGVDAVGPVQYDHNVHVGAAPCSAQQVGQNPRLTSQTSPGHLSPGPTAIEALQLRTRKPSGLSGLSVIPSSVKKEGWQKMDKQSDQTTSGWGEGPGEKARVNEVFEGGLARENMRSVVVSVSVLSVVVSVSVLSVVVSVSVLSVQPDPLCDQGMTHNAPRMRDMTETTTMEIAVWVPTETFKWTDELTAILIAWRAANDKLFTGRRNAAVKGFEEFVREKGLEGKTTPTWVKKKWENLKQKYKDMKTLSGVSTEGKATAASWKWFDAMEVAMGGRPSISLSAFIASASHDAAVASPPIKTEPRVERLTPAPQRKRKGDVLLYLRVLEEREESRQREALEREDRRFREAEEREERRERERIDREEQREREKIEREERRDREAREREDRRDREASEREERREECFLKLMALLRALLAMVMLMLPSLRCISAISSECVFLVLFNGMRRMGTWMISISHGETVMKMKALQVIYLTLLAVLAARAQVLVAGKCPRPAVVKFFDASMYQGKWYEIQKLPVLFQQGECATATYSQKKPGENVEVLNKELL
ncbi:Apolipoprotein D [Merluccius polli]|uniref:Apolipoprotein D n=1 Tax=Merluccius polli TaxID=89951 RepID=A0AA47M7A1_MERPO|nr:Apolipoprotein D [Merluccius polli]